MVTKNLILNSKNCNKVYTPMTGGNPNNPLNFGNITYTIDWSFLDEQKAYNVSFSFVSEKIQIAVTKDLYLINIPLTASAEAYTTNQNINKATTNMVGVAHSVSYDGNECYCKVSTNDNPPFTIHSRPSNNILNVTITDVANTIADIEANYVLILSFTEIK